MSEMEELVRQVVDRLTKDSVEAPPALQNNTGTATAADYPILQKPKWPRAPASRRWRKIFAVRPK